MDGFINGLRGTKKNTKQAQRDKKWQQRVAKK